MVNEEHLYSFLMNLIFQYVIHLITCRCLLTGAPARARAGLYMMVDKWISEDWSERHNLCRGRHMMMPEPAHHQGSRSLPEYQEVWVREFTSLFFVTLNFACLLIILLFSSQSASHEGQPSNEFMAYAMAHKGKATSDVSFS